MAVRLAGDRPLPSEEIDDLAGRIDAQREGRELLERCAQLSERERAAVELVDIADLTPKEAADAPECLPSFCASGFRARAVA
ncbi:MAG: hypothetical protein ABI427_09030 [Solirubrobacteraceae bacterium]